MGGIEPALVVYALYGLFPVVGDLASAQDVAGDQKGLRLHRSVIWLWEDRDLVRCTTGGND